MQYNIRTTKLLRVVNLVSLTLNKLLQFVMFPLENSHN